MHYPASDFKSADELLDAIHNNTDAVATVGDSRKADFPV
jgi:hypothetical protein